MKKIHSFDFFLLKKQTELIFKKKNLNKLFNFLTFYLSILKLFVYFKLTIAWGIAIAISHNLNKSSFS